ncbi:hypothetical protein PUNSTDRAFT_135069 [Punctularia strigosozonata HHB-11173 SS5]|uniref:uncharacterized protein n=1 Tax=Punctularia strigosozonata (strain HHB-11173) TaxID=741275 RepID=UPI0004416D37|nr:uncharacterized protein PUNSTDRAFT_135069 [Punctularia strigosozonata HHB-11173 SS5]EIN08691.1 hypothetical protein PUNSTDRAFT_135069 [Punctularia strigosozonata HHB-11173 SS5]
MTGDKADSEECVRVYAEAADHPYSTIANRLSFNKRCIAVATEVNDQTSISDAHHRAMKLLPRMAYPGVDVRSRLEILKGAQGLAVTAAMHAISNHQPRMAIEFLEHGRAILWNGILQLRSPFDGLPMELSRRLREVSSSLDEAGLSPSRNISESEVSRRRKLVDEFEELLQQSCRIPGFERLLLPLVFADLCPAASEGPVVLLIAAEDLAYGIIMPSENAETYVVSLPNAGALRTSKWSEALTHAQRTARARNRESFNIKAGKGDGGHRDDDVPSRLLIKKKNLTNVKTSHILEELWENIVNPVLTSLKLPWRGTKAIRPRLWWCPTGQFVFLLLHAAGTASGMCTSDYVVSSYTPSLGALVEARKQRNTSPSDIQVLLVAQPEVADNEPLPMAAEEVSQLAIMHPPERLVSIIQEARAAPAEQSSRGTMSTTTVSDVREAISQASVVHLACHAKQDRNDPLSSGFILDGGTLTIADIARVRMPRAFFAFLSACESTAGDEALPDEIVHLAGSILFAGFKSVVGTMW